MKQNQNGQMYLAAHLRGSDDASNDQVKIWVFIVALAIIVGVGNHLLMKASDYLPF